MRDNRFIPLFIFLALLSMPIIFVVMLNYFFNIVKYSNITLESIKELWNFVVLIAQNIFQKNMKWQIYFSLFWAIFPPIVFLLALRPKKYGISHGKARFATKNDIEYYKFTPKMIFTFYRAKGLMNKLKCLFIPFVKINPLLNINFDRGFLCGDFVARGIFGNKRLPLYQNNALSVLIVAPPGAGKSAAVAIPNLLRLPTSCIVLDIKGELCETSAGFRQQVLNNEIYIFNPFGTPYEDKQTGKIRLLKDSNIKFNPLARKCVEHLDFPQKKQLVEQIANTIFTSENKSDEHWTNSAKNLFNFYALYDICVKGEATFFSIARGMSRTYKDINRESPFFEKIIEVNEDNEPILDENGKYKYKLGENFEMLYYQQCAMQKFANINLKENWITDMSDEDIQKIAKDNNTEILDITLTDMANKLSQMNENEFASVKSTFNRFMSVFTHKDVAETTSDMSFEYTDMRKKNITLYVKIAQTDIDTLAPLIRILLECFAKNLMTIESNKENERIYLILDEFVRFGKMPFLLEMPALCRSYNIVPLYITQSYAQIKKVYGDDDLKIQKGTTAFQILFKMTIVEDAENVAKEVGKFTIQDRSYSTSQNQMFLGGTSSYKTEGRELLTAQDILNIPDDEIIIIISGHKAKPIIVKSHYYFKDKQDLKKLKIKYDPNYKVKQEKVAVEAQIIPDKQIKINIQEQNQNNLEIEAQKAQLKRLEVSPLARDLERLKNDIQVKKLKKVFSLAPIPDEFLVNKIQETSNALEALKEVRENISQEKDEQNIDLKTLTQEELNLLEYSMENNIGVENMDENSITIFKEKIEQERERRCKEKRNLLMESLELNLYPDRLLDVSRVSTNQLQEKICQ